MPLDHSPSKSVQSLKSKIQRLRDSDDFGHWTLDFWTRDWSRRRDSNPHPLVYETNALSSLSYSASNFYSLFLEARGGVEPHTFRPTV
jgi:hypothetical protein